MKCKIFKFKYNIKFTHELTTKKDYDKRGNYMLR